MNTTYLILPGYGNSGPGHWQRYFESQLPRCYRIVPSSWEKPEVEDWINAIQSAITSFDQASVVVITHSLGGIALAHWAKRYPTKIKGAMIVAPPDIENPWKDYGLESFTPIPLFPFPFPSLLVASTDDPWASPGKTEHFAQHWGCKLHFIGPSGHINTESGYGDWKEGLEILKNEYGN